MKEKITNFTIISILVVLLGIIFLNSSTIVTNVIFASKIWFYRVFPSLFIFYTISDLLINYNFIYYLNKIFSNFFTKLFKINPNTSFIFFMSLFSGCPSNAKFTKELLDKKYIDEIDASKIMCFSFFSNPIFIITMGLTIFNSLLMAFIVLGSHYFGNIIIGLFMRNKLVHKTSYKPITYSKPLPIRDVLPKSIMKSINVLSLILGIIILFVVLNSLIGNLFKFTPITKLILGSFLELTQGLNLLKSINLSITIKVVLSTMILSFGGLSIHMQIKSILNEKVNLKYFFKARIFHMFISGTLACIIIHIVSLLV